MFQIMFALVVVVSVFYYMFYQTFDWWNKRSTKKEANQKDKEEEEEKLKKANPQEDLNHNGMSRKRPSIKDVRTKSRKIDPFLFDRKMFAWLNPLPPCPCGHTINF